MSENTSTKTKNVTMNDVKLASIYYPILIDLAKHKHCLTYGELVAKAKELHPDDPFVKKAVPVSAGRRLDVVRDFTEKHGYPDLTSLIINRGTGKPGKGFPRRNNSHEVQEAVFAFDWSTATTDFDGFTTHLSDEIAVKRKFKAPKKLTESEAKVLVYEYFKKNKSSLQGNLNKRRDFIVKQLMAGVPIDEAYSLALAQI